MLNMLRSCRHLAIFGLFWAVSACASGDETRPVTTQELRDYATSKHTEEEIRQVRKKAVEIFAEADAKYQKEKTALASAEAKEMQERASKCSDFAFAEKNKDFCRSPKIYGLEPIPVYRSVDDVYLQLLLGECYWYGAPPSVQNARKSGCLAPKK